VKKFLLLLVLASSFCAAQLNISMPFRSNTGDPFAACRLADTTGRTLISECGSYPGGNYYLNAPLTSEGSCIGVTGANFNLAMQGYKILFGTNPANFTQQLTNKAFTSAVTNNLQVLPRPTGPTTTDATTASPIEMTDLRCDLDANASYETVYVKDTDYKISYEWPHGHRWTNQGFWWASPPPNGTACTATYKISYPRYGIINSGFNQENRNTGNVTAGQPGMTVDCGEIEAADTGMVYSAPIFDDTDNLTVTNTVLTARGWSASAIKSQRNRGQEIAYNTMRIDSDSGEVFNRDQFDGYVYRNGANDTENGTINRIHHNIIDDGYHGGITTFQPNSEIYNNTIKTRSRYTNDFAFALEHCGGKAYNNTVNNYDASDNTVGGRGGRLDVCGGEIYSNTINVYATPFNIEYSGCQTGGVYGIQNEKGAEGSVHDNVITVYVGPCSGQALRVTTTAFTVNNETYKSIRLPGATADAWGLTPREGNGLNVIGATSIEADTYIIRDESQTTLSNPSNVRYVGTIFKKGTNPAAGFHTWSMANFAQLTGTTAIHTCVDCVVQNGASLTDVSARNLTELSGYYKPYEIWIKWSRTFNVKVGGVNQSGFDVVMTDVASGTYSNGQTDASGNVTIEVPQYHMYNTDTVAVNTAVLNPYSVAISKAGCTTVNLTNQSYSSAGTQNVSTTCP
jgi:hypothetical protein